MTTRITNIKDLHNLSIKDTKRMPHPCLLSRWSDMGLYKIDVDAGRFVVAQPDAPRIESGKHKGRVDLMALRMQGWS